MSYESENTLPKGTRPEAIFAFLELLGYERLKGRYPMRRPNVIDFNWFSNSNYESNTGVEASVRISEKGKPVVYTRTPAARSCHDLKQQNRTIREIQQRFGGHFITDEGRNRCWSIRGVCPPPPDARGVRRAYSRFRFSLMQISMYRSSISVTPERKKATGIYWMDVLNPSILANNLLLPFLTAALEDFFKSGFIALLRYSGKKDIYFKNARLTSAHLSRISDGKFTVEEAVAEVLPFQRISAICDHFKVLDSGLDLAGCLLSPYRRRRVSLHASLEAMVEKRHRLIHQNELAIDYVDEQVKADIHNLEIAAERCFFRMNSHYKWHFSKSDL